MLISCVFFILAGIIDVPNATAQSCPNPIVVRKDVVIIGTGMAGLSAGKRLREVDSNLSFVILERQGPERLGGRVRSNDEWFPGYVVEEGANWISEIPGNPALALAERYSLDMFQHDFENLSRYQYNATNASSQAEVIEDRAWYEAMQYFATAANCLKQQSKKLFNDWQDYNPATDGALNVLGGNECDWSVRPAVANLDYYARWQFLDYEFAQKDTSMYSFLKRKNFIAKLYFVMDQDQGFQKLPISFAREYLGFTEGVGGANFQFRQTVAAIRYNRADAVYKTAVETNVDSQGCPRYRFEAKRVISTLPVGVLRSQDVRFDPPLPYGENPFVMADYIKVFYQFDEKFWEGTDDKEFIVSLKKANNDGKCNTWTSLDYSSSANTPYTSSQIIPGSRIIFCTLTTETLNQLLSEAGGNDLSDAQLRGELLEPLKRIFGADIVASVVSIKYSDLWKNPSFYGSYENWRVGPDLKAYYQYHGGILPYGDPIESCDANTRSRSLDEQHATLPASTSAVQRPPRPTRRRPRPTAAPVRRPTRAPTSRPTPAPPVHNGCTPNGLWTLHISGSASCAASWGFVHGAIEAGERSANYVLADIGCRGIGCAVSTESSCDDLESQANSP